MTQPALEPTPAPAPAPVPTPAPTPAPAPEPDKGFPDNTRPEDMQPAEQAAYYRAQARKHEDRNKDLLRITGGKFGTDLKADLDALVELRRQSQTEAERAVSEAQEATRAEVRKEFGTKLAAAEFRAALAHVDGERRDQIIEGLSFEKYLTDTGDVDTAKVKSYAAIIAPADKGAGNQRHDYGAGRRVDGLSPRAGSVAQVIADRRAAREKK